MTRTSRKTRGTRRPRERGSAPQSLPMRPPLTLRLTSWPRARSRVSRWWTTSRRQGRRRASGFRGLGDAPRRGNLPPTPEEVAFLGRTVRMGQPFVLVVTRGIQKAGRAGEAAVCQGNHPSDLGSFPRCRHCQAGADGFGRHGPPYLQRHPRRLQPRVSHPVPCWTSRRIP